MSQKPPWGLALMSRGSMSAVPSSAGMRASMHSGTGPHSCRLFCAAHPRFEVGQTQALCGMTDRAACTSAELCAAAGCSVQPSRLAVSQVALKLHGHASREVRAWHMVRVRFLGASVCAVTLA